MTPRTLAIALAMATALPTSARAEDPCSQIFIYAVNQLCRLLPNGQNLCQPVALTGPSPACEVPANARLTPVPLAPPTLQFPQLPQFQPFQPVAPVFPPSFPPTFPYAGPAAIPNPYMPRVAPMYSAPMYPGIPPFAGFPAPAFQAWAPPTVPAPTVPVPTTPVAPATTMVIAPAEKASAVEAPTPVAPLATAPATAAPSVEAPAAATPVVATPVVATPIVAVPVVAVPVAAPAASTAATVAPPQAAPVTTENPATSTQASVPVTATPSVQAADAAPAPTATPAAAPQATGVVVEDALAHFAFDSAELTEAGRTTLDKWLAKAPVGMPVVVAGYADRLGPEPYNAGLSARRADSVRSYLVSKGKDGRDIRTLAKGEADPVKRCKGGANPATKACLAPNRRVEINPE